MCIDNWQEENKKIKTGTHKMAAKRSLNIQTIKSNKNLVCLKLKSKVKKKKKFEQLLLLKRI